ncbi:MAG TPA: hypothetical protein VN655_06445 [Pseudolabrys sp.]|jgi:hypothetical protein|nr:hypothetical protein [Pseudolabrys sp.]
MTPADTSDDTTLSYSYRPSLLGAEWNLTLEPEGLAFSAGARSGFVRYAAIARLRMAYRPTSMQATRFVTEIWAPDQPPLRIVSTTWKSMVLQPRLDAAYTRFVGALHARIAAANGNFTCERGRPALIYWPGLLVFIGVSLGLALLIVRALQAHAAVPAVFVAIFFALFVWHGGTFFSRNRPGTYRVGAPPRDLMPG